MLEAFGERIKTLRKSKGLNQTKLAESVGISQVAIAKIERGLTKNITLKTAVAIADKLEVSLYDFFKVEDRYHQQQIDRVNAQRWTYDIFTENLEHIKEVALNLLGKLAENLYIPHKSEGIKSKLNDDYLKDLCILEYFWIIAGNLGLLKDADMVDFLNRKGYFDNDGSIDNLKSWFNDFRRDKGEIKWHCDYDFSKFDFYGILNLKEESFFKDRK